MTDNIFVLVSRRDNGNSVEFKASSIEEVIATLALEVSGYNGGSLSFHHNVDGLRVEVNVGPTLDVTFEEVCWDLDCDSFDWDHAMAALVFIDLNNSEDDY